MLTYKKVQKTLLLSGAVSYGILLLYAAYLLGGKPVGCFDALSRRIVETLQTALVCQITAIGGAAALSALENRE